MENRMDRGAWWATVHGVAKSRTRLSDFPLGLGGFPESSAGKEYACNAGDPCLIPGLGRSPGEGIRYTFQLFTGFPGGSDSKEPACNVGDLGLMQVDFLPVEVPRKPIYLHKQV